MINHCDQNEVISHESEISSFSILLKPTEANSTKSNLHTCLQIKTDLL